MNFLCGLDAASQIVLYSQINNDEYNLVIYHHYTFIAIEIVRIEFHFFYSVNLDRIRGIRNGRLEKRHQNQNHNWDRKILGRKNLCWLNRISELKIYINICRNLTGMESKKLLQMKLIRKKIK